MTNQYGENSPANGYAYAQMPMPAIANGSEPLSVGQYLLMLIVTMIPVVGLIMLLVWGFGDSNINRRNFARASLILGVAAIVLAIVFGGLLIGLMSVITENYSNL